MRDSPLAAHVESRVFVLLSHQCSGSYMRESHRLTRREQPPHPVFQISYFRSTNGQLSPKLGSPPDPHSLASPCTPSSSPSSTESVSPEVSSLLASRSPPPPPEVRELASFASKIIPKKMSLLLASPRPHSAGLSLPSRQIILLTGLTSGLLGTPRCWGDMFRLLSLTEHGLRSGTGRGAPGGSGATCVRPILSHTLLSRHTRPNPSSAPEDARLGTVLLCWGKSPELRIK